MLSTYALVPTVANFDMMVYTGQSSQRICICGIQDKSWCLKRISVHGWSMFIAYLNDILYQIFELGQLIYLNDRNQLLSIFALIFYIDHFDFLVFIYLKKECVL